jgi:hypothetical protein
MRSLMHNPALEDDEIAFFEYVTRGLGHSTVVIEGVDVAAPLREYLTEIIERGVATGELTSDPPAMKQVALVYRILEDAITWKLAGSEADVTLRHDMLLKLLLDGIRS